MNVNKEIGVDGIYVVHGIKGYEAREKMLNRVLGEELGLDFEFVTESFDTSINEDWIKRYFTHDVKSVLTHGAYRSYTSIALQF